MKRLTAITLAVGMAASGLFAKEPEGVAIPLQGPLPPGKPHIDIVFCIDCSGSMGGVIETAKQKVWQIVNEVAKAKPTPILRIGLLGYGNADRTFRQFDLSDDLDDVYRNLTTFKDEGWGDEFVGLAVHKAAGEMHWASGAKNLKVIFVVGNETARQGPANMDYTRTAAEAKTGDIVVNAIYCGDTEYATATPSWREMAKIGAGRYMEIGAQGGAVAIATPFDPELAELSKKINTTYVAYGARARVASENQVAQDAATASVGGSVAAAQRAYSKSTALYRNSTWDLVDAAKDKDFKLESVKEEELPAEMKTMSFDERKAYIEKKTAERAEIQKQIQELTVKRDAVVKEELAKKGLSVDKAFDENVKKALIDQAAQKGFEF